MVSNYAETTHGVQTRFPAPGSASIFEHLQHRHISLKSTWISDAHLARASITDFDKGTDIKPFCLRLIDALLPVPRIPFCFA